MNLLRVLFCVFMYSLHPISLADTNNLWMVLDVYHPAWECVKGNVFSRVCLFQLRRVPMWPLPTPVQTCSNGDSPQPLSPYRDPWPLEMFKRVHLDLTTQRGLPPGLAGKQAVGLDWKAFFKIARVKCWSCVSVCIWEKHLLNGYLSAHVSFRCW